MSRTDVDPASRTNPSPENAIWQAIYNNWNNISTNSTTRLFALPPDVPMPIRHLLNRALVTGKSSLGTAEPIQYSELYPSAASELQSWIIDETVNLGQSLALEAGQPIIRTSNPDPPASQNSSLPRIPNSSVPDKFDGTRSKYATFITQLQLLFRSDPSGFSSDEAKIVTAGSYLTGPAYLWFQPHIDSITGDISYTKFSKFIEALGAAFDDPDSYATAERELESLRQEASCASYYAKMVSLFSLLGWKEEKVHIHFFRRGLKESLKDSLVGKTLPTTFAEFATICIGLDNEIFARDKERKAKTYFAQNQPRVSSLPILRPNLLPPAPQILHHDPMEIDNSEAGKAARRAYRKTNNLCGYCGGSGHRIGDCPKLAKRASYSGTRIANVEIGDNEEEKPVPIFESKN